MSFIILEKQPERENHYRQRAGKNGLTKRMHFYTMHELQRMHTAGEMPIARITPEQEVLLEKHGLREGRYDFLVELENGRFLGIEVLARPSRGKMKEKLSYASEVDEFIFVLPAGAMELYRKPGKKLFHSYARVKKFPREFCDGNLYIWLFDPAGKNFSEKARFSKVFNVER